MGVPSFFRWLSRKYPKIISPVLEDTPQVVDGVQLPIDYSSPNPNGELDNLYLDMNGIVHPCSHPENKPPPETEDEMLLAVFEYTNRVLNMARPRKVLVMAVDGVAPRAKMNQQRSRRFRSARDAQIANEAKEEELRKRENYGEIIDDAVKSKKTWDSNAITPGTPFMDKLALALRYWTAFKLATDPGWKNLQIIISDATVPGEGEHKIMNFIRSQRADPEYNPNTTHCIYGLDADLIFLGLATHEPHFKILREDVFAQDNRRRNNDMSRMSSEENELMMKQDAQKPFLWLHINVLREYLSAELFVQRLPFAFDLERAIDDWVFMCFFCGNDFLPHLPSLDVRENSIDILLDIWKAMLPSLKTYMTCDGELNLESVELVLTQLGMREPEIFKSKHTQEIRKQEAIERRKQMKKGNNYKNQDPQSTIPIEQLPMYDTSGNLAPGAWNLTTHDMVELKKEIMLANEGDEKAIAIVRAQSDKNNKLLNEITPEEKEKLVQTANKSNYSAAELLKRKLMAKKHRLEEEEEKNVEDEENKVPLKKLKTEADDLDQKISGDIAEDLESDVTTGTTNTEVSTPMDTTLSDNVISKIPRSIISSSELTGGVIDTDDTVRLYESGYRERYYTGKFNITESEIEEVRKGMVKSYIEGVSWVLLYYYQGCPSWNWYYPYHYAPFAADFFGFSKQEVKFELGEPFLPYEQLMSVLPAASGHTLPPIFRPLMSEPDSPIIDFYPSEFLIDMNGKKMSWQGIALLPFIDEKRLLKVVREQYPKLTEAERSRNCRKEAIVLISNKNAHYDKFVKKLYKEEGEATNLHVGHFKTGLSGIIGRDVEGFQLNAKYPCPIQSESLQEISTNLFLKMMYKLVPLPAKNKSLILNGFIPSQPFLDQYELDAVMYKMGNRNNNRWRFNETMQNNIVPVGPHGTTQYKPRVGGYRSFFYFGNNKAGNNNIQYQNNYNSTGAYNRGYQQNNNGDYGNQRYGATGNNRNYNNQRGVNRNYNNNNNRGQNYNNHHSNYNGGYQNRSGNNNNQGRYNTGNGSRYQGNR